MARVIVNKAQMARVLQRIPSVQNSLSEKARKVLQKAQELAPQDTGDLARSLRVVTSIEKGVVVYRIVSDDPNIKEILYGTKGPYNSVPPWGPTSALGRWGQRHGFTTNRARYSLARSIAIHGTQPAGTHEGKNDWIKEALKEVTR